MECVLQLFSSGQWSDAAVVDVPRPELGGVGGRATFEYDLAHAFGVNPEPVSLTLPVSTEIAMLEQWPAFLFDLIPQGAGRTFLLGELGLPDNAGSDFALLRSCARARSIQLGACESGKPSTTSRHIRRDTPRHKPDCRWRRFLLAARPSWNAC